MGNDNASNLGTLEKQQLETLRMNIQNVLRSYGQTLSSVTQTLFGFEKEQFNIKALAFLLNKIHKTFGNPEAGIIIRALGDRRKIIQRQDLQLFLNQNDKKEHPFENKFLQFRQFVKEEGSITYLQSFDFDGDNALTINDMDLLLSSMQFTSVQKQYILKKLFGTKIIATTSDLIKALNLSNYEFKQQKACSLMMLSKTKHGISSPPSIKIPEALENCLNQNFKVNQKFINWLATVVSSGKRFIDFDKPAIKSEHKYVHISQLYKQYFLFEMRTSIIKRDAFRKGPGMIMEARNIRQGHGKDCYILSALSGVVQYYPEHVYNLFLIDKTEADIFVVKLFIDGEWRLIFTDAEFPINNKGKLVYAQPSKHQIWVLLIEKAWAKVFGSYINIQEGSNEEGFVAITGAPCLRFEANKADHLSQIKHYLIKGYIASVSTNKLNNMPRQEQKQLGIYANHAYTLLYIVQNAVDAVTKQATTLIYLRNPWGRGTWKGAWSFDYPGWSKELRQKLNYMKNPKDGSFFMALQDFKKYFSKIKICCINPSSTNSSIRLKSEAIKFIANIFTIKRKGDYFLSIYQQNKRKYRNTNQQYKLSDCNIYVAKLREGRFIEPIGSKAVSHANLSIEVSLQPGEYICVTRVKWNNKPEGQFVLTSYGPQSLIFSSVKLKDNFFHQFIRLNANEEIGDKSYYGQIGSLQSYKIVFMSSELGYGYILICNNEENKTMRGYISLENVKGISMIPPYSFKLVIQIQAKSCEVFPCMVSPSGYQYKIVEQMEIN